MQTVTAPQGTGPKLARAATPAKPSRSVASKPRVVKARPGRVLYFGFGANLDPAVVQRRGLKPASSEKGTLHNHKLYFNHVGGYGNIEYKPGDHARPDVEGVILDLSSAEMRLLAATEGGYDVRPVLVSTSDGDTVEARAFFSNWSVRLFEETKPTALYISKLRTGAKEFGLSAAYQEWLARVAESTERGHQRDSLRSPATFLAGAAAFAILGGVTALLVRPARL